jgi:hypothetical protein
MDTDGAVGETYEGGVDCGGGEGRFFVREGGAKLGSSICLARRRVDSYCFKPQTVCGLRSPD